MDQSSYIQDLEARIERAKQVLADLKAEHHSALQARQHDEIDRLETHLASTEHKLADLRLASAEAWEEIKDSIESLWVDVAGWIRERVERPPRR